MIYKLSNVAEKNTVEEAVNIQFRFPNMYKPKMVYDGFNEIVIPIITIENRKYIQQAIWGILPENYDGEWNDFQKIVNTQFISLKKLKKHLIFKESLLKRRCLVIVTGFVTAYLKEGGLKRYLIQQKNRMPFYLAGIYNVTDDGFSTCSIITTKKSHFLSEYQNITSLMPIKIDDNKQEKWLNPDLSERELMKAIKPFDDFSDFEIKEMTE